MKTIQCKAIVCLTLALTGSVAFGQEGTASASVGVARAGANSHRGFGGALMPPPEFFRVEEFVNYHRHDLPLPKGKDRVRLDLQQLSLDSGRKILQFGITTPRVLEGEDLPPLNVVLVIDESGSMSGEKIENLKESLHAFVGRFREGDRVAIVGFNQRARLALPATRNTTTKKIREAINSIVADGGTNLHAGLMMGFRQAMQNFDAERTNRVIFLTDGNANVGETQATEIAQQSQRCVDEGISLVTIGLGVDFNNGLLRQIADSGHGVMHYVGDAKDIRKTFVKEINSLLAPAASDVRLKINFDNATGVDVFGYKEKVKRQGDKITIRLDDLNCSATQVVLAKVPKKQISGSVTLTYTDAATGKRVNTEIDFEELANEPSRSIKRNYAISQIAWGLRSAAQLCHDNKESKAVSELESALRKANKYCDPKDDAHVRDAAKIANGYLEKLRPNNAKESNWGDDCER